MVYVPNKYRSHEIAKRIPSSCGWDLLLLGTIKNFFYYLFIHSTVPPIIEEAMTSGDMMVREGTNITLTCRARGFPDPYVMWRREDSNEMFVHGENGNKCFYSCFI